MKIFSYDIVIANQVNRAVIRNTVPITNVAITFSFCSNVLIFFIHKSFLVSKKGLRKFQRNDWKETK
jgi:hypothetical protein